jgi:hypothetical protein
MSLNTILATAPLTTTNYILKATGTTIGNSLIFDNGTNVGIGTASPAYTLDVSGTGRFSGNVTIGSTSTSIGGLLVIGGSSIGTANANNGQIYLGATAAYRGVISYDEGPGYLYIDNTYNNASSNIYFRTKTSGTAITAMTILGTGNVGIGTSTGNGKLIIKQSSTALFEGLNVYASTNDSFVGIGHTGSLAVINSSYNSTGNYSPLAFYTSDVERMRIISSGQVGINMTPGSDRQFMVKGIDTTSNNFVVTFQNTAAYLFQIRNDGLIITGSSAASPYNNTTTSADYLVVGTSGILYRLVASSQRYKEEIKEWNGNGLETILALKPKTFKYKKDYYDKADVDFLGLIAEDVAEVSPYLATYENEDRTGQVENVRYANIVVPLIAAIQELNERLIKLESK